MRQLLSCTVGQMTITAVLLAQPAANPEIPKGTQISVRTLDAIHSKQGEVGQSYRCSVEEPVRVGQNEVVAKGADCVLRIVELKNAGKLTGQSEVRLVVSELRVGRELRKVESEPATISGKGKGKATAVRTGIGAGAGAAVGAIFGGRRGAAIGAGAGGAAGAASSALTQGPEIKVASETVLTFLIQ